MGLHLRPESEHPHSRPDGFLQISCAEYRWELTPDVARSPTRFSSQDRHAVEIGVCRQDRAIPFVNDSGA